MNELNELVGYLLANPIFLAPLLFALALVVFATWRPLRVLAGAYLFGAVGILQFHAQAHGVSIPSQFLSALPYAATIAVLVIISRNRILTRINTPACLGRPFVPDR